MRLPRPDKSGLAMTTLTNEIVTLGGVYPECNRRASLAMTESMIFISKAITSSPTVLWRKD
jgi:hypothetical protein